MKLFKFHFDNKIYLILITSIVWAFNFRVTFKNIYMHMGLGSYAALKFEPLLYLIKNIICIFYLIGFFFEIKTNPYKFKKELVYSTSNDSSSNNQQEIASRNNDILKQLAKSQHLNNLGKKILFGVRVFFMILFISIVEDSYFIYSNNHVIDRVICPIRNFCILLSLSIFSIILMKKKFYRNKHQLIPFIIIFCISVTIFIINNTDIERFKKKYSGLNMIIYMITFFFIGVESIFIKLLTDSKYLSIYLILGLKGIIGTIIMSIIYIQYTQEEFFNFFDRNFAFEYEFLNESFPLFYKILYIISLVFLEYLKIFTINQLSENHILSCLMITDIIFFPFYCIERFAVQGFGISTPSLFWLNLSVGFVNCFLILISNEILECNFWGLNTNLKINIIKRQNSEFKKTKKSDERRNTIGDYILNEEDEEDEEDDTFEGNKIYL